MKTTKNILLSFLLIFFSACSKDDDNAPAPSGNNNTGITIDSPWQYSIKIGGTAYSRTEGSQNFQGSFSWSGSLTVPPDSSSTDFGSGLNDSNSPNFGLSIDKGRVSFLGNTVDTAIFKAYIHTGSFPYSVGPVNGIVIKWTDGNGNFYSSDAGTGDQTGSNFTITDVKMLGFVFGNYEIKFKATFNCKLYDIFTGASITLTDGIYVGKFENYN